MAKNSSLGKIAKAMHKEALENGKAQVVLSRGLRVKLWYRESDIVLVLWRNNIAPSPKEVEICSRNFFADAKPSCFKQNGRYIYVGVQKEDFYSCGMQEELDFKG